MPDLSNDFLRPQPSDQALQPEAYSAHQGNTARGSPPQVGVSSPAEFPEQEEAQEVQRVLSPSYKQNG